MREGAQKGADPGALPPRDPVQASEPRIARALGFTPPGSGRFHLASTRADTAGVTSRFSNWMNLNS